MSKRTRVEEEKKNKESSSLKKINSRNLHQHQHSKTTHTKLHAILSIGHENKYLGAFDTVEEMAAAYDSAQSNPLVASVIIHPSVKSNSKKKFESFQPKPRETKRALYSYLYETGYFGVLQKEEKYFATISIDGRLFYLGIFSTSYDAAKAYDVGAMNEHSKKNISFFFTCTCSACFVPILYFIMELNLLTLTYLII